MYWASPLLARAVTLGVVEPNRLGRLARRLPRGKSDLPACDWAWADALLRARLITRYQAQALLTPSEDDTSSRANADAWPLQIGPYMVLDRVGRSDLGATYRCRQSGSREHVAVKLVSERWALSDSVVESLDRELEGWRAVASGPVARGRQAVLISARRVEQEPGRLALVSRWVGGRSLAELLYAGRRPSPAGALAWWQDVVASLAAADTRGLIHGDICPTNLLVAGNRIALTDCGIRRIIPAARLTADRQLPPHRYEYVAPEIALGAEPDASSEIYALGCLLYHLLTGRPPYWGGSAARKCAAHAAGRLTDPRMLGIDLPAEIRRILSATLEADRSRRVGSYNELLSMVSPARAVRRSVGGATALPAGRVATWSGPVASLKYGVAACLVAAAAWGVVQASDHLVPLLHLPTSRTKALVPEQPASSSPSPAAADRGAVTALWNATEDLRRAYRDAPPNGTITLRSPGPFLLDALEISKPITLRGADDIRPLFLGGPGSALRVAASARFENVHFVRVATELPGQTTRQARELVTVASSNAQFVNCSFQDLSGNAEPATGIEWHNAATDPSALVELRNVVFKNLAAGVSLIGKEAGRLAIENGLHAGPGPLVRSASSHSESFGAIEVNLSQVTVAGASTIVHSFPHPLDRVLPLRVVADRCLLVPRERDQPMLAVAYASQPNLLMPSVSWSGSDSACPADSKLLEVSRGPEASAWQAHDIAAWNAYWGTHATGLLGLRIAFDPDDGLPTIRPARPGDELRYGVDLDKLCYPAPVTLEQLPRLIERLSARRE